MKRPEMKRLAINQKVLNGIRPSPAPFAGAAAFSLCMQPTLASWISRGQYGCANLMAFELQ